MIEVEVSTSPYAPKRSSTSPYAPKRSSTSIEVYRSFFLFQFSIHLNIDFPVLDVVTRWNSTLDMLECGLRLKKPINLFLAENSHVYRDEHKKDKFTSLNETDWDRIKEIAVFLKPFKKATLSASGAKITTLSEQLPWYSFLLDLLDDGRQVGFNTPYN